MVVRPWNHIVQVHLHGSLTNVEKKMYIELTRAVGVLYEDQDQKKEIVSTSRQSRGETKTMPQFPLSEPMLTEYMK